MGHKFAVRKSLMQFATAIFFKPFVTISGCTVQYQTKKNDALLALLHNYIPHFAIFCNDLPGTPHFETAPRSHQIWDQMGRGNLEKLLVWSSVKIHFPIWVKNIKSIQKLASNYPAPVALPAYRMFFFLVLSQCFMCWVNVPPLHRVGFPSDMPSSKLT